MDNQGRRPEMVVRRLMDMRTRILVSTALVLGFAAGAAAQSPAEAPTTPSTPPASASSTNNEQFGLNLSRIQRGLQKSAERQEYEGLNLRYFVAVYAPAPPIRLFTPLDNLLYGQAPYGGPTHREMMDLITPREHRAPAADLSGIARWLANRAKK
jgi:hypothetical protein